MNVPATPVPPISSMMISLLWSSMAERASVEHRQLGRVRRVFRDILHDHVAELEFDAGAAEQHFALLAQDRGHPAAHGATTKEGHSDSSA